ncbi:polyphosphate kinase 1 [Thiohalobacter sp.]|uniref:polyphosphate kinase 1 n=1 Tax=Thiohalobacter sp. TaxID=2025948 RepID=UPI00262A1DE7|nr:polyphosphate kinase 1 [Thiohalobacter sp.]
MDAISLTSPDLYINRELSLLAFNRRVLEQARDPDTPLLERLKFLCISSTNLDEFFEIRVAGLKQKLESGSVETGSDGLTPQEALAQISAEAHDLVDLQYRVLNDELIPALESEQIRFLRRSDWSETQAQWVQKYFSQELMPVLSPLGLDPAHPFPRILNKSLNFIVSLEGKDAFGRSGGIAIVQAPRSLPRLIRLPESSGAGPYDFVFLSSVIHAHVDELFPGMKVTGCYQFRVTRNSDLFVDEEEIDDLMRAMEGELLSRRYGDAVRLEVADNCSRRMADFLLAQFGLTEADLYQVNGPVNLNRLIAIADLVERPDLKYLPFKPSRPTALPAEQNIFEILRRQDVLLHHPFESFAPVLDFLRQAATDPQVLAIKQTLYRTGPDSAVVDALVAAARNGKEVTVVVELRARFDEEANIQLANRLQEAGAHVTYGVVGYKTHAKMILVTRREGRRLRHYVHLGTGNYHARTARLYTDYGLLTADKVIGEDVRRIFQQLTSLGKVKPLRKLLQSPFTLHKALMEKIEREAAFARQGKRARIIAKMNALIEPQIIQALYAASQAGVRIDLIVRGVCCLRPGVPGVSERIQVRSIVGRFLEHTRVFHFRNDGNEELWLSSADWMDRNFFRRVETCFPVEDPTLRKQIMKEGLELYLADNTQAWVLHRDGHYRRQRPRGRQKPRCAQCELLELRARPG